MPKLDLSAGAVRDLNGIRGADLGRIRSRILALEHDPRPHGVKKLEGHLHRIRIGDWRVLYSIDDKTSVVVVLRVIRRSERTYKHL